MNEQTKLYVRQHADDDVRQLALRGCKDTAVDLPLALQQIQGRQTARRKLPSWAAVEGVLYPPRLSMEQCSSEATARYKASIVSRQPDNRTLVDLTGGFGVDIAFMSQCFNTAVYVERNEELCALAAHNMPLLTATPVTTVCSDGMDHLLGMDRCSLLFLDPARRNDSGGRTYALADCTPNVVPVVDRLLDKADNVLLKLSPMLDWRKAVADVGREHVAEVHIVAVDNECKELLLVLRRPAQPMRFFCADINSVSGTVTTFAVPSTPQTEADASLRPYCLLSPDTGKRRFLSEYLYEPNAAIMKAGCFQALSHAFDVAPLAHNSHLFVSDSRMEDFPGRRFIIDAVTSMNKAELKQALAGIKRANITVRNFPMSAEELRKRLKLADGGDDYIFATTLSDGSRCLLLCRKDK